MSSAAFSLAIRAIASWRRAETMCVLISSIGDAIGKPKAGSVNWETAVTMSAKEIRTWVKYFKVSSWSALRATRASIIA